MEKLSEGHLSDPVSPPARYGSVLQVNQTMQEREQDDVVFTRAIRRPLPAHGPGFYSPIPYNPDLNQRGREANRRALTRHRLKRKERERLARQQLLSRLESQVIKFLRYGGSLPQGNLPRRFDHLESPLDVIYKEIDFVERQLEELLSTKLGQVGISPNKGLSTDQLEAKLLQFWKNR